LSEGDGRRVAGGPELVHSASQGPRVHLGERAVPVPETLPVLLAGLEPHFPIEHRSWLAFVYTNTDTRLFDHERPGVACTWHARHSARLQPLALGCRSPERPMSASASAPAS